MSDDKPGKPADERLAPDAKTIIGAQKRPLSASEYSYSRPQEAREAIPAAPTDRTIVGKSAAGASARATMIGAPGPSKRPTMPGINVTPNQPTVIVAPEETVPPSTMP